MTIDKRNQISDYVFVSKYARTINGKKETWEQAVDRVMMMHANELMPKITPGMEAEFSDIWARVSQAYKEKRILGAQRALQYGGSQMLKKNMRMYNCTSSYLNRVSFFKELMYILLCGAGGGYSAQKVHTNMLPELKGVDKKNREQYVIEDSIEGWAYAVDKLIKSYYYGLPEVFFDYSNIRPRGAHISGGFKAPGPDPLKKCLMKIRDLLEPINGRKLRPFELHRICCLIADAVISGGIRRSAMVCLFDSDDKEMMKCKTGDWFERYPELCRCNNSVVILPTTSKEDYDYAFKQTQKFGEPGIAFLKKDNYSYNPCFEVGMFPQVQKDGKTEYGWSTCNLSEINGNHIETEQDFYLACELAAAIGTFQAAYTDFNPDMVGSATIDIVRRDALIGVGITGMHNNPKIMFDPEVQRKGAIIVKNTNANVAKMIGINPAARTTVVKPSGNSSQLLGSASGVHPYHFRKYIRNIQAADTEQASIEYGKINPNSIHDSVYNPGLEKILSFPVTIPDTATTREDFTTEEMMNLVKLTQENWIEYGTNTNHESYRENPDLRMNVSNTITVNNGEWEHVREYLFNNRDYFCGVSLLPASGDLDYPQAPYTSYLDEFELAKTYGPGAILSSGLIVDGLNVFDNIWQACNAAVGLADSLLKLEDSDMAQFIISNIKDGKFLIDNDGVMVSDVNAVICMLKNRVNKRVDWVRRFKKFANSYMGGDLNKTANCLKHVNVFHTWNRIKDAENIDWSRIEWDEVAKNAGDEIATGCAGGKCEI